MNDPSEPSLENLPQPVKDHVLEESRKEWEQKDYRFSVSELVYCLRKPFYRRKAPVPIDLERAWYFFRGNLFHEAFAKLFTKNEVSMTHRIKGTPIVISGRCDVIYEDRIVEFKTTNSLRYVDGVKPQHRLQASFYAWCQGLPKAEVIYLDLNNVMKFIFFPEDKDVEKLEDLAKILYSSIQTCIPPPPSNREDWECKKCEYSDVCDKRIVSKVNKQV